MDFNSLTENYINDFIPNRKGVYIIRMRKDLGFCNDLKEHDDWKGLIKLNKTAKAKAQSSLFGLYKTKTTVYSNVVYIGYTTDLRRRLKEHLEGRGSEAIRRFFRYKKDSLFFSYESTKDPEKKEKELYKGYIQDSGGYCPPFDCGSSLCRDLKGVGGVCADMAHKKRTYNLCA